MMWSKLSSSDSRFPILALAFASIDAGLANPVPQAGRSDPRSMLAADTFVFSDARDGSVP